jgi:hypothetical protein
MSIHLKACLDAIAAQYSNPLKLLGSRFLQPSNFIGQPCDIQTHSPSVSRSLPPIQKYSPVVKYNYGITMWYLKICGH